jgi:protein gp37
MPSGPPWFYRFASPTIRGATLFKASFPFPRRAAAPSSPAWRRLYHRGGITPGCAHCYAETFAERFRGVRGHPYEQGFDLRLVPEKLAEPLRWKTPKMIFVNSMSDLFHKDVPDDYVMNVVRVMQTANWHTYQVLTKRSERQRDMLQTILLAAAAEPHIWWGVSVENRKHGLPRIDHLRSAPARVRFLSIEPLIEDLGEINLEGIHWVIVGGESGAGARPIEKEWVLSIRDQCERAEVPFFFKQWGGVQQAESWTGRSTTNFPAARRFPYWTILAGRPRSSQ